MLVHWTETAQESFEEEIQFVLAKWNLKEVEKFIDLVDDFVLKLPRTPFIGKQSVKKGIRTFVLSKQTTVVYEVFEDKQRIDLQYFWNNQRDPAERNFFKK